jgi:AraC-like DNA-binding protein
MQNIGPFQHARVSTKDFPENKRLAMWREIYGRAITNVDIEPIGDQPFHADVTFNLLPNVNIVAGSRSPAHYYATPELIARGGQDMVALSVLRSGAASATQFGNELIDGIGSAAVLTPSDPSISSMLTPGTFITLAVSRPMVAALMPDYTQSFGRSIPVQNAALALLIRYLDVVRSGDELTTPAVGQRIADHIIDLSVLALGARGDRAELARQRGGKAARLGAIRSDILNSLGRNDLSTELIAARHGISPRYVRKLFEEDGSSFSAFVLSERVMRAHRMLVDRRFAHLNIAQVAHESGFSDISYFNRAFRRHFGARPSDYRETARLTWQEQEH